MLLPESTEEVAIHAEAIAYDDLIAALPDGKALQLLSRIEEEEIPAGKIPALVLRSARPATMSLFPPAPPS